MTEQPKYCIIPDPFKLNKKQGVFVLPYDLKILMNLNSGADEYRYAKLLSETVYKETGIKAAIEKGGRPESDCVYLCNTCEEKCGEPEAENYELSVEKTGITISAGSSKGILYGIQTLRQLISQCKMTIPCMHIDDCPAIPNRGFFHDATRGRIGKLDHYKRLADKCSYYKLNQLQLYIEHSFMFKEFSEVWRDDTPLTAGDILELDMYCKNIGVELVPAIATLAHLDKVLKTKSFAGLCELPDSDKERFTFRGRMEHHTLNISDPEAWEFVKKMLDEFMPLFSSKKFNLCGDETFDLGKGRSKALADKIGTDRMYVDFIGKICRYLVANGRRPLFWGDIIVNSPELVKELPEGTVCLTWGYAEDEEERQVKTMYDAGAVQYLCPGVHGWRHMMNRLGSAYLNISTMGKYAIKYHALGFLNTDWGDYGHVSDPRFSLPGLIYGAEYAWKGSVPDADTENGRISRTEYGDRTGKTVDILTRLGNCEGATWENVVEYMEYMTGEKKPSLSEQKEFFLGMNVSDVSEKNEEIEGLVTELAAVSGELSEEARRIIPVYMLHAKGQMLINSLMGTIGTKILKCMKVTKNKRGLPGALDPKELAGLLENWYNEYKESFRETSRESELYRVSSVFTWYEDILRENA